MSNLTKDKGIILFAGNNPHYLPLLDKILTENGYKIFSALNGKLALTMSQSILPDLILLDIRMSEIDAYSVCKIIKDDDATRDIPVIFMGTIDDPINKSKAFNVGGLDYIISPFESEEVLVKVKTQIYIQNMQKKMACQNKQLQLEIAERELTEKQLQTIHQEFEIRVKERTKYLESANNNLQAEFQQRKNAQPQLQQTQKREVVGSLAGRISHDLNNILTIIHTCAQLVMADISQDRSAYVNMEKIIKAVQRASEMVDQILTFGSNNQTIKVDSKLNQGTKSNVYFPMNKNVEQSQPKTQPSVLKGNVHVLLIDDEINLLNTVQLLLEHLGYKVSAFINSVDAFCEFEKNPQRFDIAIVDLAMPQMNGIELTKKIKAIRKDLPVVISSGDKSEVSDKEMNQLGINGFLLKPFLKAELSKCIRRFLSA
jgi:DNA-binding response OmpR family regulator